MAGIPDDKVQEVRDRVDIVDLIGRYVQLRRSGQNYKGLCPFHEERTGSFNVNPARRGYKCFGCGQSGDAIRFVMELEGRSFPEAIRKLAELYGVSLPEASEHDTRQSAARKSERDEAYAILGHASKHYREMLVTAPEGEVGRAYQAERGISEEIAERFQLGYAPDPTEAGWDPLCRSLAKAKLSLETAEHLGLCAKGKRQGSYYDSFFGRLMFPVIQPGGEVVAFSGRIVPAHAQERDGRPPAKYWNSKESSVFHKGKTLFGLNVARPGIRSAKRALLVEGNIDVVALHQRGYAETIAPLGTALTSDQARLLSRFTNQVILCFDGDEAGKRAAAAALPILLDQDIDPRIVLLEDGEDPDSVDPERFAGLLERARPALEVMMIRLAARAGGAIDARARYLEQIVRLIARVGRSAARFMYAERAAELFQFPQRRIMDALKHSAGKPPAGVSTRPQAVPVSAPVPGLPPLPDGQADLTSLLVDIPHLATVAERNGLLDHVTDPRLSPIARAVIDGAKRGEDPGLAELLELIEPSAQEQVHAKVFAGKYRASGGEPNLDVDPEVEFLTLLHRCREQQIEQEIQQLDERTRTAQQRGNVEQARELQQQRLELRRRQAELRSRGPSVAPQPASS